MSEPQERPPYLGALSVTALVFLIYALTLAPTPGFWDSSEYITTAYILGIPHPPGNPLFVVLGRTWSLLLSPLGLSVAARVNLLAAFTSALSSGFLFLVAHRVISGFATKRWVALAGAAASALIGATAYTVWNQSNVNEKVYSVSVLVMAAVSWLAVRWMDRRDEPGSERLLLGAIYLIVLGNTNHLMSVLPAPSLVLFILMVSPGVLLRKSFLTRAIPLALVGASLNFYLPIRAAERPVVNEGDPRCESVAGAAVAVYTQGKAGCPALGSVLTREQYQKPPITERMAPFSHQLSNWFQYFDWQWARGVEASEVPGNARLPFTLLFLLLGLTGLLALWQTDKRLFVYLGSLSLILSFGLVFYLNFRYGYSLAPEIADRNLHEVRERDYFFIAGFLLWGVMSGVGLTWAWDRVATVMGERGHALTAAVLLVAVVPLALNKSWASRSDDSASRSWAYNLLMSVEPYGVIFTNGDNDTFPLWYLQEVEGVRKDVTVIVGQYLFTDWYPRQLQELTTAERQRPFEVAQGAGIYQERDAPVDPIISATPEEMDQVTGGIVDRDVTVPFPAMAVTYPAGTPLDRVHRMALSIIHDSIDERPIYFASTGGLMAELGLDRFAVRQGLVSKLVLRSLEGEPPAGFVRGAPEMGAEWFDYARSLALYQDVYEYAGLRDRDVWFDRATLNIPWHFYAMALQLSDVAEQQGEPESLIRSLQADAEAFLTVSEGGLKGTPTT